MNMNVITVKVPLYQYDENDQVCRMDEDEVREIVHELRCETDMCGWTIHQFIVEEEVLSGVGPIEVPVVTFKIPLYMYDDYDRVELLEEDLMLDIMGNIIAQEDINGWSIYSVTMQEEEIELNLGQKEGKISIEFNDRAELKEIRDVVVSYMTSIVDHETFLDDPESQISLTRMFRVINEMEVKGEFNSRIDVPVPIFFQEEFETEYSYIDDDQLVFHGFEYMAGIVLKVDYVSKYKVVNDDVILCGRNINDNGCICLLVINKPDWELIMKHIEEIKCWDKDKG